MRYVSACVYTCVCVYVHVYLVSVLKTEDSTSQRSCHRSCDPLGLTGATSVWVALVGGVAAEQSRPIGEKIPDQEKHISLSGRGHSAQRAQRPEN